MTYEQLIAQRARNASGCLGSISRLNDYTDFAESPISRSDVRTVDIPFATSTTSGSLQVVHVMPAGSVTVNPYGYNYLAAFGGCVVIPPKWGVKANEVLEYFNQPVFDELQTLRSDESKFRSVLEDLKSKTAIQEREYIADRLATLLEDFQSDSGRSLDADSLRTFVALLSLYPKLKRPHITADEKGYLFAEWKNEDGKRSLGVLILPMRQIRFVAFRPDESSAVRKKHISGLSSVGQLFKDLSSYDVLTWASVD